MTEQTEVKPEKTPGDLKREEIARSIGEGWQFYQNYPAQKQHGEPHMSSMLEILKNEGKIENWRAEQPAFDAHDNQFRFDQARAAYIKPKPDRPNRPWYKR